MTESRPKDVKIVLRRCLAGVLCLAFIPFVFQRMDEVYVVPQRLKRMIEVISVKTELGKEWYRARVQLRHRGFKPCDVALTMFWLDKDEEEIGRNDSDVSLSPGDTVNIRLSLKAPDGRRAAGHRLEYTVKLVR